MLRDAHLVFSHVIPLDQQKKPEAHAAWRLAAELGATVETQLSAKVSHVVAGSDGTDKVRWARAHGVHTVSVDWLASCGYEWRVADEASMRVDSSTGKGKAPPADRLNAQLGNKLPPPELSTEATKKAAP